jgi:hypothetical protein
VPQPRSIRLDDHNPLDDFSLERGGIRAPSRLPTQPHQPFASPVVTGPAPPNTATAGAINALRERVTLLEKSLDRSTKDINQLKDEIATLVGVIRDIRKGLGNLDTVAGR